MSGYSILTKTWALPNAVVQSIHAYLLYKCCIINYYFVADEPIAKVPTQSKGPEYSDSSTELDLSIEMTKEEKFNIRQDKKQSISRDSKSFPQFVISEPVTIRQSVFQQNATAQSMANQSISHSATDAFGSKLERKTFSLAANKLDNEFLNLLKSPETKTNANEAKLYEQNCIPNKSKSNEFSAFIKECKNQAPNSSLAFDLIDKDQSVDLLEPMKCVSIDDSSLQNQSSTSKASEQSHFSIENPYTMQFNLNMTSIKNSTVLGTPLRKNTNQINQSHMHQQSVHIKDEPNSVVKTACIDSSNDDLDLSMELTEKERAKMRQQHKKNEMRSIQNIGNSKSASTLPNITQPQTQLMANQSNGNKVANDNNDLDSDVVIIEDTDDISVLLKEPEPENSIYINQSECRYSPVPLNEWETDVTGNAENKYVFSMNRTQVSGFSVEEVNKNLNPFDTDFQNNLLNDIQFDDYISKLENCTMVNRVRPILSNEPYAIGNKNFDIQKMIGRGSFAFVYRLVLF